MKPRVVTSLTNETGDHCVDIFVRDDASFGFEECRRDAEDGRGWFALNRFGHVRFPTQHEALAEARARVEWLAAVDAVRIRRASAADRAALDDLYDACRRDAQWLPAEKRRRASFDDVCAGEAVFVAVDGAGEILGLVSAWEADSFIHHLYVRERSRNRGVGHALLASLSNWLPFPWRLKCVRANTQALDFYAKREWRPIGTGHGSEGEYVELQLDASARIPP